MHERLEGILYIQGSIIYGCVLGGKKAYYFMWKHFFHVKFCILHKSDRVTINVAQFITCSPSLLQSETVLQNTVRPFIASELYFLATMDSTLSLSAQITFRVSQDPIEGRICHSLHIINLETAWINDERRTVQSGAGATAPEDATTHLCECCDQSEFEGSQLCAFCLLSKPESCVHTHTHTRTPSSSNRCLYRSRRTFDRIYLLI